MRQVAASGLAYELIAALRLEAAQVFDHLARPLGIVREVLRHAQVVPGLAIHRLQAGGFLKGKGGIAMLAKLNPLGVMAAAVFVAGILVGADSMSRAVGVPTYIADVIVAVALIAMLVATMLTQYRVRWK